MVHFGPTAVSGSSGNDNGASSLDGTALVDQGLEGEPPVIEQVTLRATGPSWVTLRRDGRVVFDGSLEGEKVVNQPADVEIYAGRPDLVEVSAEGLSARMVGTIDDLRWLPCCLDQSVKRQVGLGDECARVFDQELESIFGG